jgi:leucyl aminopeptidase
MNFASKLLVSACVLALATPADARRPVRFAAAPEAAGSLVLPLSSAAELATRGAMLDDAARASIARALEAAKFDYKEGSKLALRGIGPWRQLVVIGAGSGALDNRRAQNLAGSAVQAAGGEDGPVSLIATGLGDAGVAAQLGVGAALGGYSFDRYKTGEAMPAPQAFTIVTADVAGAQARHRAEGAALVEAMDWTRDIITEPSNVKYPEVFVTRATEALRGVAGVRVTALDVPAMERLNMGSLLSVGLGSTRPPRLLIVEYKGSGGTEQPIVLAGKGITFDSGGISLKPGLGMWRMKTDMSGAAAVVGAVMSLAKSRAPVNVIAIAALAENMPGGNATRPGDIVKAHNGKTIEVLNTDAEGRLVLADAVAYAESRYRPAAIVDVATLTGSIVAALGDEYAGVFSHHDALADQLVTAGATTGEALWRMPLDADHAKTMKSDVADIKNVSEGANAGASLGAHFIGYFAKPDTPWAHLDIAGTAWSSEARPTAPAGAVGYGVRLLDRFVRDYRPVPRGVPAK